MTRRSISSLLYREFKLETRWRPAILSRLISSLAYLLLFSLSLGTYIKSVDYGSHQVSYIYFALPGLIILQTYIQGFNKCLTMASNEKRWGILRLILTSRVSPFDYLASKILFETILILLQSILLVFLGILVIPDFAANINLLSVSGFLVVLVLSVMFWASLGTLIGVRVEREHTRDLFLIVLGLPLSFSSTVFYSLDNAPWIIRVLGALNPITYATNAGRAFLMGDINQAMLLTFVPLALSVCSIAVSLAIVKNTKLISEQT